MSTTTKQEQLKAVKPGHYTRRDVSIITGISRSSLSRMATSGTGPECIHPKGYGCALYPIDKLHEWLELGAKTASTTTCRGREPKRSNQPKRKGRRTKKEEVSTRKRCAADA